ncbi:MAG: zinc-binding alcohol dehydrogenase [Opitutaceae bacterium]|jgi:2-desacetyl-2-hydroxyethyl bacteriochlorophyllide A dehydrogenase
MKTTALLATSIDRVELVDATVPEPGPGEVIVEALYTAISPGTEMRCLSGKQPKVSFPFILGYSMTGRIVARGAGVALAEGALVFCQGTTKANHPLAWGAHIGHALLPETGVFPLPNGVDPLEASLSKLSAIAYRGVRAANTRPHDEVAVVGLGPIGQLAARVHKLAGARVVAADLDPTRVAAAKSAGIEAIAPTQGLVAAFKSLQPGGADVVVDSTGAAPVLQQSIQLAKMKPWDNSITEPVRLIIQGSYAENVIFDYHQAFFRELSVHFPRDIQPRDIQAVLSFLAGGRLKIRDLVTRVAKPADAQEIYSALRAATPGLLTAAFKWQ